MTTKKLVIIRGKGTANEQRIETDITLYLVRGRWVTIPADEPDPAYAEYEHIKRQWSEGWREANY